MPRGLPGQTTVPGFGTLPAAALARVKGGSVLEAKGHNGQITIDGEWITIHRKGLGRLGHSKGDKRMAMSTIVAVKMRPAGALANGFIRFDQMAGSSLRDKRGGLSDATTDENA